MSKLVIMKQDDFRPEYGDINWVRRLNMALENADETMPPAIGYKEENRPTMQITQENCHIYINQVADEMDAIAVGYEPDNGLWTFMWREVFDEAPQGFESTCAILAPWAMQVVTLYPLEHVVTTYNKLAVRDIGDTIPEDW